MTNGKVSRLYLKILAYLLCVVLFSSLVLIAVSSWFSRRYEDILYQQTMRTVSAVNDQMLKNIQSVYDLCPAIMENALITENFAPYAEATTHQKYYYPAIIKLLKQGRLQMNGIIDSIFLYTDNEKVLYAQEEKGMIGYDSFFDRVICYDTYHSEFWTEKLNNRSNAVEILDPDTYHSGYVNDSRTVIPIVYSLRQKNATMVLVINLSVSNLLHQFEINESFAQKYFSVCSANGNHVYGEDVPIRTGKDGYLHAEVDGEDYLCFSAPQNVLNVTFYMMIPRNAFSVQIGYYRTIAIILIALFSAVSVFIVLRVSKHAYEPIRIVREDIRKMPEGTHPTDARNEVELIRGAINHLTDECFLYRDSNRQHSIHYIVQSIAALVEGKPVHDMAYFNMLLTKDYGFSGKGWFSASIVIDTEDGDDYILRRELVEQIRECIVSGMENAVPLICFSYQSNMLLVLADGNEQSAGLLSECLSGICAKHEYSCNIRFGVGCCVSDPEEIVKSYHMANSAVFCYGIDHPAAERFIYDQSEVRSAAYTRDIRQIEDTARDILERARMSGATYPEAVYILEDICSTVIETQNSANSGKNSFLPRQEKVNALKVLLLYPEINISPLTVVLLPHISEPVSDCESSTDKLVNSVRTYIEEHYGEELSLDILSDRMDVSPKYLSRVFKQIIGVNLSDYLTYIRVENVKKMLITDMSLNDIMQNAGINNRTTFTRIFKRLEGITPNEYRTIHRQRD